MDPYESTASDILSTSRFLQRHPANASMGSDLYSSAVNSTSELILRQRYSGQYVINSNNLNFGTQCTFYITPGSLVNGLTICGQVTVPLNSRASDLWAYHLIDSIEVKIAGTSSVQSLRISGRSMLDYILASCHSSKVEQLKSCCSCVAIRNAGVGEIRKFAIPLALFFSSPEIMAVFPLDSSTLKSQVYINIRWKQLYNVFYGTSAVTLPSTFDELYMRVFVQNQVSNNFELSNMIQRDDSLVYSLPGHYLQTYSEIQTVGAVGYGVAQNQISLSSQPEGQLQAILLSGQPVAYEGVSATTSLIFPWCQFETITVLYNGIELYRADSKEEIKAINMMCTDKDSGLNCRLRSYATTNSSTQPGEIDGSMTVIIPFVNEASKVLRERRHEHVKSYAGSTLQLFYTLSSQIRQFNSAYPVETNEYDNLAGAVKYNQPTGDYRMNVTFVNSALYEIDNRSVSMQM